MHGRTQTRFVAEHLAVKITRKFIQFQKLWLLRVRSEQDGQFSSTAKAVLDLCILTLLNTEPFTRTELLHITSPCSA